MHNILTLLSPSAALPGLLSLAYTAESQLERFERLLNLGSLAGSTQALDRIHSHLKQQSATALSLLDNMELCDTPPPIPTFKSTLARFGIDVHSPGKSEFWRVVEAAARSSSVRRWDTPAPDRGLRGYPSAVVFGVRHYHLRPVAVLVMR